MQNIIPIDLGGVNCYLIENNQRFLLIDTGGHMFMDKPYRNRRDELVYALERNGVTDSNLELIILTHGDNDHVCNAKYIREKFHSRIAMHSNDVFMVKKADFNCYKLNSNYQSHLFRLVFRIMDSKIQLLMKKVYKEFETFIPDILLEDRQSLSELNFEGSVFHCPGHTSGSICILDNQGNLISGDLFSNNKKPSLAVNAQNFEDMKKSAKKVLKNNVIQIFPGHGAPFAANRIRT